VTHEAIWHRAFPLADRLPALRRQRQSSEGPGFDHALAERRLQRWRSGKPFASPEQFARRLDAEGVTQAELYQLLGEPAEALAARSAPMPPWLADFLSAFDEPPPPDEDPSDNAAGDPAIAEAGIDPHRGALLAIIAPQIARSRRRLAAVVAAVREAHPAAPLSAHTVVNACAHSLYRDALAILERTLVLELNVARVAGRLEGDSPTQRFQSFVRSLRQPARALALFREYPVLARQLALCLDTWLCVHRELIHRLADDWPLIRETLTPAADPGELVAIRHAGDAHAGGRRVLVISCASGFRVVYKPRPQRATVHFQALLAWLNDRGATPPFATITVIDRGAYGWCEAVSQRDCTSPDEVERFYRRHGAYLALLHALEGTDAHSENIIAAGEHPVFIDVEALFHPGSFDRAGATTAVEHARARLLGSVFRVGLLPSRAWPDADSPGVDISAIGFQEGQLAPHLVPYWADAGSDEAHLARRPMVLPGNASQPLLNGEAVAAEAFVGAVKQGFAALYRLLLSRRAELLADDGPLARFAGDELRVILGPTQFYGVVLGESHHPNLLRDALDRERFLDRLWAKVDTATPIERAVSAERADLWQGDIPLFTTTPGSCDVWTSRRERLPGFFASSGMDRVRRNLHGLGEDDLAFQCWCIEASFTTLALGSPEVAASRARPATTPQAISELVSDPGRDAGADDCLRAARAVGDRLETLAVRGAAGDATWLGALIIAERYSTVVPLGSDLHAGSSGVTLFLAYLGAVTGEPRYTALAEAAFTTVQAQLATMRGRPSSIGGFVGRGGLVYVLTHLGCLWRRPELLASAGELARDVVPLIEGDQHLDVIAGAAGCIGSLLGLHQAQPSPDVLAAAVACGEHLLARAQRMEHGWGWCIPAIGRPLTGFSHGTAGIGWALLQLSAHTGDGRFRQAALEAMAYERSLFSPEAGNWPDLRFTTREYRTFWCHGATGIGLARLATLPLLDTPEVRLEIAQALAATLEQDAGSGSQCLCHGSLGNLELLSRARGLPEHARLAAEVPRRAARILADIERRGWVCGLPGGVETPGLMYGLAGIGYGLLRLAAPDRVPSVLTLEQPPRS
jgi:type 2 lantibiotic biosynthesis protein LanM